MFENQPDPADNGQATEPLPSRLPPATPEADAVQAFVADYNALCRAHGLHMVIQPYLHPEKDHPRGQLLFHGDGTLATVQGVARNA